MTFRSLSLPPAFVPSLALALSLSAVGCSGTVTEEPPRDGGASDWRELHPCSDADPSDVIEAGEARIEGDTLFVEASHSGGCEKHEYGLCYEDLWLESEPVQVGLKLLHDAHDDGCEAYLTTTLEFDLTSLGLEYTKRYQQDSGRISVSVSGQPSGSSGQVVYEFSDKDSEPSDVPTWDEIDADIKALNHCEVVDDCQGIATRACSTAYVNKDEDLTQLQKDIEARNQADSGADLIACDASCACGILTCSEGVCATASSTCEEPTLPSEMRFVCL